jgi:lipooligosaccharide transport system permease protein
MATLEARDARLGRLERSALTGVLVREVVNYSSYWKSSTFSSTVEPTIYLLAFGFGFGSLVSTIGGYDYVDFVGTGTVATAVLFSSAFPAMFGTFVKYQFQHTYTQSSLLRSTPRSWSAQRRCGLPPAPVSTAACRCS